MCCASNDRSQQSRDEAQKRVAGRLLQEGEAARSAGDLNRASARFQEVLTGNFYISNAYMGLGLVASKAGEHVSAIEYFREALRREPTAATHEAIGRAFLALGDSAQAKSHFEHSIAAEPTAVRHFLLAQCQWQGLEVDAAAISVDRALARDHSLLVASELRAQILLVRGQADRAVDALEELLRKHPENDVLRLRYVESLRLAGRTDACLVAATQSIRRWMARPIVRPRKRNVYSQDRAVIVLRNAKKLLDAAKVPFFLCAGTALGVVREGRLLGHDKDIDVAVDASNVGEAALVAALCASGEFVVSPRMYQGPEERKWRIAFLHLTERIALDAFFFHPQDEKFICGIYHPGSSILSQIPRTEPEIVQWESDSWYVPGNPAQYLTALYGENWRIPDVHFETVLSSAARLSSSIPGRLAYGYLQIYRHLCNGSFERAASLCRQAQLLQADPFLDEVIEFIERNHESSNPS